MSEPKCHINERLHTGLAQSGRAAVRTPNSQRG